MLNLAVIIDDGMYSDDLRKTNVELQVRSSVKFHMAYQTIRLLMRQPTLRHSDETRFHPTHWFEWTD